MDKKALPSLVSAFYKSEAGRPAIVVGGGPSAPTQLAAISVADRAAAVIISANAHAFKLIGRADFIFVKDHTHTETNEHMEDLLRPLGAPLVSRQYWADYRAPCWPIQGNSGAMAIGFAALLGCAPILPIGFDGYQGATYFHDADARNVSRGRLPGYWKSRMDRLAIRLEGAAIRALGAPLCHSFPAYNPNERFSQPVMPRVLRAYDGMQTYLARALRSFTFPYDRRVECEEGRIVALDAQEVAQFTRLDCVELLPDQPMPTATERRAVNGGRQQMRAAS